VPGVSTAAPTVPSGVQGVGTVSGAEGLRVLSVTSGEKDLTFQSEGVGAQILGLRDRTGSCRRMLKIRWPPCTHRNTPQRSRWLT
jgi:hypothetical protein